MRRATGGSRSSSLARINRSRTNTPQAKITRLGSIVERIMPRSRDLKTAMPRIRAAPSMLVDTVPGEVHLVPGSRVRTRSVLLLRSVPELLFICAAVRIIADARVPGIVRIEWSEAATPTGAGARLFVCAGRRARVLEGLEPVAYPPADAARSRLRTPIGGLIRGAREGDVRG